MHRIGTRLQGVREDELARLAQAFGDVAQRLADLPDGPLRPRWQQLEHLLRVHLQREQLLLRALVRACEEERLHRIDLRPPISQMFCDHEEILELIPQVREVAEGSGSHLAELSELLELLEKHCAAFDLDLYPELLDEVEGEFPAWQTTARNRTPSPEDLLRNVRTAARRNSDGRKQPPSDPAPKRAPTMSERLMAAFWSRTEDESG